MLLSKGANVNQANDAGSSPLYIAALNGLEVIVKVLLSNGADVNQADNKGETALYNAAQAGKGSMVAVLLSNGADVNQADKDGKSPLYNAAKEGKEQVVAILLSNGADVNQVDNNGRKPINVANGQKINDMLLYDLMKKKQQEEQQPMDKSLWFTAAMMGDLAVIQQGINDKIDVNCKDGEGCSALYRAAENGHLSLVEYLISNHSDLSIANVSASNVWLSNIYPNPL